MTKLHSSQAGKLPDRDDGSAPHVATALMRTLGVGELDEASSGTRSGPSLAARPLLPGFLLPRNDETASRNPAPFAIPAPDSSLRGQAARIPLLHRCHGSSPPLSGGSSFPLLQDIIWSRRYIGVHIILSMRFSHLNAATYREAMATASIWTEQPRIQCGGRTPQTKAAGGCLGNAVCQMSKEASNWLRSV